MAAQTKPKVNTLGGITTTIFSEDKRVVIVRTQDVEPILEQNKRLQNSRTRSGYDPKAFLNHYAHIPNIVIEHWMKLGINIFNKNDEKKINQLLNSPEWSYLKTVTGKV